MSCLIFWSLTEMKILLNYCLVTIGSTAHPLTILTKPTTPFWSTSTKWSIASVQCVIITWSSGSQRTTNLLPRAPVSFVRTASRSCTIRRTIRNCVTLRRTHTNTTCKSRLQIVHLQIMLAFIIDTQQFKLDLRVFPIIMYHDYDKYFIPAYLSDDTGCFTYQ